jgi:hypothetical protein
LKESACQVALIGMLKAQLATFALNMAAALDGSTELSDQGRIVMLIDDRGAGIDDLHTDLMALFERQLFLQE